MKPAILCLAVLLTLTGCATLQATDEHVDFDPSDTSAFYRDEWVRKSPLEVHVQPAARAEFAPKALFLPFRVTQPMDNPGILGYSTARVIWQTWLTMQVFPAMEFSGDDVPYRRDRAVQLGRMRGADVVVGGFVTYVYAGGTAGDSQLAVQIEVMDTASGQMIWSFAQSGLMPAGRTRDYFLFTVKTRLPSDPLQAIAKSIAIDTGKRVQNWQSGAPEQDNLEKLDQKAKNTLFPDHNQTPPPRTQPEGAREQRAF